MPLTENDIVHAVAGYLVENGWTILQQLNTMEQGVDLIASRTNVRLLVEAKGGTSSKEHTNRFGEPFNGRQVRSHVSVALYCAAKLQGLHPADAVALALPDDSPHRAAIEAIRTALGKLAITVYFVAEDRSVCEWSAVGAG